jgi:hypothetical protein
MFPVSSKPLARCEMQGMPEWHGASRRIPCEMQSISYHIREVV